MEGPTEGDGSVTGVVPGGRGGGAAGKGQASRGGGEGGQSDMVQDSKSVVRRIF